MMTMKKLIFSSEIMTGARQEEAETRKSLGKEHYSYGFVANRFKKAFERTGLPVEYVGSPHALKHPYAVRAVFGVDPSEIVHLAFRSTANLRPLAGAHNICHFAWEFSVLKDVTAATEPITLNQVHMLGLMDEIWVPSRYTRDVLVSYGLKNVAIVPTPMCDAELPARMTSQAAFDLLGSVPVVPLIWSTGQPPKENLANMGMALRSLRKLPVLAAKQEGRSGRVFLTVCNPHDLRKNLFSMIEGFQLATGDSAADLFIIKCIVPNIDVFSRSALFYGLGRQFRGPGAFQDERIVFVVDYLSQAEMTALYSLADFYVCASHCEGFNMPLLEAMALGMVPITTTNTAMADYIDPTVAVIIDEKIYPSPVPEMAADSTGRTYPLSVASRFDVARAIRKAAGLSQAEWLRISNAARHRVHQQYSEKQIMQAIRDLLPDLFTSTRSQDKSVDLEMKRIGLGT